MRPRRGLGLRAWSIGGRALFAFREIPDVYNFGKHASRGKLWRCWGSEQPCSDPTCIATATAGSVNSTMPDLRALSRAESDSSRTMFFEISIDLMLL